LGIINSTNLILPKAHNTKKVACIEPKNKKYPYLSRPNAPLRVYDMWETSNNVKQLAHSYSEEAFGITDNILHGKECFFEHFTSRMHISSGAIGANK
jgi:hypothetical protein